MNHTVGQEVKMLSRRRDCTMLKENKGNFLIERKSFRIPIASLSMVFFLLYTWAKEKKLTITVLQLNKCFGCYILQHWCDPLHLLFFSFDGGYKQRYLCLELPESGLSSIFCCSAFLRHTHRCYRMSA